MLYCPTARNFYRIRRILIETLGLPRNAIRPSTTLAELIQPHQRRRVQQRFQQERLRFPWISFTHLQWYFILCAFGVSLLVGLTVLPHPSLAGPAGFVGGAFAITALWRQASAIDGTYTVAMAVRKNTRMCHFIEAGYTPTRKDIADRVLDIISDNLGVNRDELTPETRFKEDIGAD